MSLKLLFKSMLRRKLILVLLLLQLVVTLALIVNSGLLAMHARDLLNRDTGLDLDNTLIVHLKPSSPSLGEEPALSDLLERQMSTLREINGVTAVAYASQAPLKEGGSNGDVADFDDPEHIHVSETPVTAASVDIFKALNVKVIEGQIPTAVDPLIDFENFDRDKFDIRTRTLIVSQSLAKRLYGDQSAVGRATNNGRIVAVVADFAGQTISENINYQLFTMEHLYAGASPYVLVVHLEPGMAEKVKPTLADRLRAVNNNIDIFWVRSLAEQRDELYSRQSGLAILLSTLALLMLLVAMISAYSSAFFHALKQQQEIGIKRAIGASQGLILQELFTEAWLTTGLGCTLGIVACFALNKLLASVLAIPEVPMWLPNLVIALMIICVTLATWYPARAASNISPVTATKSL